MNSQKTNTERLADARVAASAARSGSKKTPENLLHIRRSDRLFIVGATGTGKTTIVRMLLAHQNWVVILDPKHQYNEHGKYRRDSSTGLRYCILPDGTRTFVTSKLSDAVKIDEPDVQIIYQPSLIECRAGCPAFWEWIWKREQTLVYVDEVIAVSPAVNIPPGYGRCIQMGRSRNIGVWSATQRPARIPVNLLSESEHVLAFELRNPNDLKRIAEFTDPIVLVDRARGHEVWYYDVRKRDPIKMEGQKDGSLKLLNRYDKG